MARSHRDLRRPIREPPKQPASLPVCRVPWTVLRRLLSPSFCWNAPQRFPPMSLCNFIPETAQCPVLRAKQMPQGSLPALPNPLLHEPLLCARCLLRRPQW